jgi:hypothetical protein
MIKVGVTENVVLTSGAVTELNGNKSLKIGFRELGTEIKEKKVQSAAAMMSEATDNTGDSTGETMITIFPPNMKVFGSEETKEGKDLLASLVQVKAQLHHILKRYTVETSIKWNPFIGTSVNVNDDDDVMAKLAIATVFEAVFLNFANQFIAQATKFMNVDAKPCRILLIRQSATKSFGTFRKNFLNDQPFLESMDIPASNSKLLIAVTATGQKTKFHDPIDGFLPRYTDYELKKGLDSPIRVDAEADKTTSSEEGAPVEALFSAGAADAMPNFAVDAAA